MKILQFTFRCINNKMRINVFLINIIAGLISKSICRSLVVNTFETDFLIFNQT